MKKDEVPQDDANILEGKLKVVKYAVDSDGSYTKVKSVGWEPENIVLGQAWEDINEHVEEVKAKVKSGQLSPIAYHMAKQMLDPSMVAGYTGFPVFLVKLHLRPWFFRRLSEKRLEKYASAFRISREALTKLD
jgi:hypothetical protein